MTSINENLRNTPLTTPENVPPTKTNPENDFGFFDFLDIINPLQHIPVVNIAYRAITHDEMKPIGDIIGGAIFGGAIGAAAGLINTIFREETGKDIAGNVLSLFQKEDEIATTTPEQLSKERIAYKDLPASLLAFIQTPASTENQSKKDIINNYNIDKHTFYEEKRTAGKIVSYGQDQTMS